MDADGNKGVVPGRSTNSMCVFAFIECGLKQHLGYLF